mmetsp:Transcript_22399/g.43637  ORF Transcript_22399/g.43637 Transcript_22399/m.43637 type:complete len:206 (-) Transcript_22399:32-649(-)
MRHHCACCNDALCGAKVFTKAPRSLDCVHEPCSSLRAAHNIEPEHATVEIVAMVLVSKIFLRMRSKAWVHNFGDLGMALKELGNGQSRLALLPHTQRHCLCRLHNHEGSKWMQDIAMHILNPLHLLRQLCILGHDRTTHHHVVALIVLCQALDHHIGTMVQWSANNWSCKCCIDHVLCTTFLRNSGDSLYVAQREEWVCRSLAED